MGRPSSPTTVIGVKSIDHVTLVVRDLERSRHFYCDILGMVPADRPAFNFDGLWFQAGNTQVHVILEIEGCASPGYPNVTPETKAGLAHHFAFEVDDAHEAAEELQQRDILIMGGPSRRPDGCIQIWFYDPDGHVVEVFHRPDRA